MTRRARALLLCSTLALLVASCNQPLPAGAVKALRTYIQEQGSGEFERIHQATSNSRYGFEEEWCVWVVESTSGGTAFSASEEPRLAAYYLVQRDGVWEVALDPLVAPDGWRLWKYDLHCPVIEQTR